MSRIKIKSKKEIELLRNAGELAAETLARAGELAKPGITTNEINDFVYNFTIKNHAIPAPLNYNGFPKSVCTSVNEVVTHGIPCDYILKEGDIINIDITSKLSGYHGDTSKTFTVGEVSEEAKTLIKASYESLMSSIEVCNEESVRFLDIAYAIEDVIYDYGFSIVQDYCGHGIGRGFHEEPSVVHYDDGRISPFIKPGMVFTIEPMINVGTHKTILLDDDWTAVTADGKLSAQFEHTLAITDNGVEILTPYR